MIGITPFLERLNDPHDPLYYPVRLFRCAAVSYLTTALLTSLSPLHSACFMTLAYAIVEVTRPIFIWAFEAYRSYPLVPLAVQALTLVSANLSARTITWLILSFSPSMRQICQLNILFLMGFWVYRFAVSYFYTISGHATYDPFRGIEREP
jgi:hypothetical protein